MQQVAYQDRVSSVYPVQHGVPRGSILGQVLYMLYTSQLDQLVAKHRLRLHQYPNDNQIYISVLASNIDAAIKCFAACLTDVEAWLRASRLCLNPTKTQVMFLDSIPFLNWPDLNTSRPSWFFHHGCQLSMSLAASVSSSTVDSQCQHTSPPSAMAASTRCTSFYLSSDRCQ